MQDVRYTQSLHESVNMLRSKLISWDFYHCLHNNIILDCGKNAREIGGWVVFRSVTWCAGRMTVESCVITLIMSGHSWHNPLRAASLAMHCRDRNHNRYRFDSFFKMFEKIDLSFVSILTIRFLIPISYIILSSDVADSPDSSDVGWKCSEWFSTIKPISPILPITSLQSPQPKKTSC